MKTYLIIAITTLFFLTSCKEKIDISLDEAASKIVIEGSITNELKEHEVRVSRTAGYLQINASPAVSGAMVVLSDGEQEITLVETSPGLYKTIPALAGVSGKTYALTVTVDGASYRADASLIPVVPMDSIAVTRASMPLNPDAVWEPGKVYYNLGVYCQEPGNECNYYLFDACRNGVLVTDTIWEKMFSDDILFNGSYILGMSALQIDAEPGDTVVLKMYSISKGYCYFLNALQQASQTGNPFSGTPANVQSNFSGGACGYFWAGAMTEAFGIAR